MKTVFAIGRWMPIHLGHKGFLVKLAKTFDRLVIGIGSCYENGTPRNCIPAIEREKLLRKMLKTEGITNAIIIPIQDRETFEEWIADVCRVCELYQVTHFCTGNKEDILDVLLKKGMSLNAEMINPEDDSDFPYHATDIRNAILRKDFDLLDNMIPLEIKPMVLNQIAREIERASVGQGQAFIPGRQTVDTVFTVTHTDGKTYALIGKRNMQKIDFPGVWAIPGGAINEFESPIDAAARSFLLESGIKITIQDNSCEPARITIDNLDSMSAELHFTGIYASEDERINGTRGGGSQCFAIHINGDLNRITSILNPVKDLEIVRFIDVDDIHKMVLAYDQKRMLYHALVHLGIPFDNGELLEEFDTNGNPLGKGVSRKEAHCNGIFHGASHVYLYRWENRDLKILLQRRSRMKDSFPGCLDMSSGGHIEFGSSFLETAQKEVQEELGVTIPTEQFSELFKQKIEYYGSFHNKPFIDREYNIIYAVKFDTADTGIFALQESELSEVIWISADEISTELDLNNPEFCMNGNEMRRTIQLLKKATIVN